MRELNELIKAKSMEAPKNLQKSLDKLVNKLESFTHCPVDLKEYKRMEPFASDSELVRCIIDIMKKYKIPEEEFAIFDTVSYWYCIALLSFAGGEEIKTFLESLTKELMESHHRDLGLLKRNMNMLSELTYLHSMEVTIDEYFHNMDIHSEAYKWAGEIGLQIPDEFWVMEFVLSTDGDIKYAFQLSDDEKENRLEISVKCHTPRGNGQCYEIKMKNYLNDIRVRYDNLSDCRNLYFKNQTIPLKNANSIRALKELISEIEQRTGLSFERKLAYFRGPKGVKKDALQKWIRLS